MPADARNSTPVMSTTTALGELLAASEIAFSRSGAVSMSTTPDTDTTLVESMRRSSIAQLLEAAPSTLTSTLPTSPSGDSTASLPGEVEYPEAGHELGQGMA